MSIRQLENKLLVVKAQIRPYAVSVDEKFSLIIGANMTNNEYTDVLNALNNLSKDKYSIEPFVDSMEKNHANLRNIINVGIHTISQLIHHSELINGGKCGKVDRGNLLWVEIFEAIAQYVQINPELYSQETKHSHQERIDIIYDIVVNQMYQYVPLVFNNVPKHDVVPLTTQNLKRGGTRSVETNQRHANSVISYQSDLGSTVTPSYHSTSHHYPEAVSSLAPTVYKNPRRHRKSRKKNVNNAEVHDYMRHQESIVSGNVSAHTTENGRLRINLPGK
jgi:hypothetical protein